MSTQNVVLILGYNNTRINDVKKIKEKALSYLNAATVLCKKFPTEDDKCAVDYVIDVDLEGTMQNVDIVVEYTKKHSLTVIGILPFSDHGTQLGGALSEKMGLKGPNSSKVEAALNKYVFRENEQNASSLPYGYKKIHFEKIISLDQLKNLHEKLKGNIFLKPSKEGNSRGCIDLRLKSNIQDAWNEVEKYVDAGLVAEELITNAAEYSWDHVAGFSWITEKKTTKNQYRAEIQQIVPAPLDKGVETILQEAGRFIGEISGHISGACHNEVFYLKETNQASGVEPNLRPAGMRIWDLASLAFENFDPWKEWLLDSANQLESSRLTLKQNYYAGIRMIPASKKGILKSFPVTDLKKASTKDVEVIEIVWTKKVGDIFTGFAKDNSDFAGYIIARSKSYEKLSNFLNSYSNNLSRKLIVI